MSFHYQHSNLMLHPCTSSLISNIIYRYVLFLVAIDLHFSVFAPLALPNSLQIKGDITHCAYCDVSKTTVSKSPHQNNDIWSNYSTWNQH